MSRFAESLRRSRRHETLVHLFTTKDGTMEGRQDYGNA